MSDKKNIDRLFQEKLKHFEAAPNEALWNRIHDRLHKDERKRRVIPFWWKVAGVAALMALLLTVGIKLNSTDVEVDTTNPMVDIENQLANTPVETNKPDSKNSSQFEVTNTDGNENASISENGSNSDNTVHDNSGKTSNDHSNNNQVDQKFAPVRNVENNRIATEDKSSTKNYGPQKEKSNEGNLTGPFEVPQSDKNAVAEVSIEEKNNSEQGNLDIQKATAETDKLLPYSKKDTDSKVSDATDEIDKIISEETNEDKKTISIEEAIADANTEDEKEKKLSRWNISPNVAPVYFNSLGQGSPLDNQFVDNNKSGDITMSYGVGGSYAISERLKVRAGVNKVDMGYNTNNVIAYRSIDLTGRTSSRIAHVRMNDNSENMTYLSTESLNSTVTPEIINSKSKGSLNQRFGFIEVPLEMEYALLNTKFGINLIGGFSTLFVDKNEIYSVIEGNEIHIGEADNINTMSYSANFGFGLDYHLSEKIKVNVEPTFKYQINTFNNSSGDFQPYFIGVYTGLSYKF